MCNRTAGLDLSTGFPVGRLLLCSQLGLVTMKKTAIFGCGTAGRRAFLLLRSKYKVVTFLDNNKRQQGSRVLGVRVQDPETYDYRQVEHVFIGSMYCDEILVQLLALGVPSSKIEFVNNDILTRDPVYTTRGRSLFSLAMHSLLRAFYVPFRVLR
jgi:hypothetical protein